MLGLADPYIARHGEPSPIYYPGHLRMAPIQYLVDRGVNLVMMVRVDEPVDPKRTSYRLSELVALYLVVDLHDLPKDAKVIEVPTDHDSAFLMFYLTPHPGVDAAIERNHWRVFPIEQTCVESDIPPQVQFTGSATCPE